MEISTEHSSSVLDVEKGCKMEEYKLDAQVEEVANTVADIGKMLRTDAISKSFAPEAEYKKQLNILTGCYMFLIVEFKKWRAIKENNEVAKYCQLKTDQTAKFVSAQAEREASNFVCKERYVRDVLEAIVLAAEQGIYTIKKHLESDTKEKNLS